MYQRFISVCRSIADRIAVTNELHSATYAGLLEQTEALRPLVRPAPGTITIVLVALPGGPHFTAVQLACIAEPGAVAVPVPARSTAHETRNYLRLIRPSLVVVESSKAAGPMLEALEEPVTVLSLSDDGRDCPPHRVLTWAQVMKSGKDMEPVCSYKADLPPDTVLIQFTSGSTGTPKGVLLSRRNLLACLDNNADFLKGFSGEHVFCPMPQFHAFGGAVVLEHLFYGTSVHLSNRFMPGEELGRMQRHRCAMILSAPHYIRLLLQLKIMTPEHLPDLKALCLGTAPVDRELVCAVRRNFPDLYVCLRYGLTETVGTAIRLVIPPGEDLKENGLAGSPVSGVEVADLPRPDSGEPQEIRVRSNIVAEGVLNAPDCRESLVDSNGFFATGDLGYLDEAGQVYLQGRISNFIKRNGFRINPFETESLLRMIPGVQEAVVTGIPDPVAGEQIIACIETENSAEKPGIQDILKICRENLSPHKMPQRVVFMEKLPRTASGKPDRPAIRIYLDN